MASEANASGFRDVLSTTPSSRIAVAKEFHSADRANQALTAAMEKKLLLWIARRLPERVNSDHLTVLGAVAQVGAGACYALAARNRYALLGAVLCIALNWFGDSLDGTLARVRNQQRPRYGFYVDHMADVIGAIAMMVGLGFSGYLHWAVAIAMLLAFLVLAVESYLASYTLGEFKMSQGVFGPTEIRILLVIGTITLIFHPYSNLFGHRFLLFDVGGVIATCGMAGMAVVTTFLHGRALFRAEPLG
jgi:phosphatidylglycerophosphate synthase